MWGFLSLSAKLNPNCSSRKWAFCMNEMKGKEDKTASGVISNALHVSTGPRRQCFTITLHHLFQI